MGKLPELFDLSNRVAIVTGGSGLLGKQFARTLAEAGATVVLVDIDITHASDVVAYLQGQGLEADTFQVDVTNPASLKEMMTFVLEKYGQVDILVNSAAIDPKFDPEHAKLNDGATGAFENFPLEMWNKALNVNLTGVFLACQAVVPAMLSVGKGVIVNIASIYGMVGPDQRLYQKDGEQKQFKPVYYTVTKAGVLGLTKYLATYYAGKNIRVNALTPGGVYHGHDDTFLKAYAYRAVMGRMANQDEMNGALLFLASDASSYMTGANLVVDGGWTAW